MPRRVRLVSTSAISKIIKRSNQQVNLVSNYPHACGEHFVFVPELLIITGSSPRFESILVLILIFLKTAFLLKIITFSPQKEAYFYHRSLVVKRSPWSDLNYTCFRLSRLLDAGNCL